jgi:hypothetical protein
MMFKILHRPSHFLNIFAATFWLIVVYPCAASTFATVACPLCCTFANLLVIVVATTCTASTASCLSSTRTGGSAATHASNTPAENAKNAEEYRRRAAAAQVGRPRRLSSIHWSVPFCDPRLLVKFDVQNITFNEKYFEHHLEERSHAPLLPLPPFLLQPLPQLPPLPMTMTSAASSDNGGGRQRWQKKSKWQRHTTINQQRAAIVAKTVFVAAAAATAVFVAAAVSMVSMITGSCDSLFGKLQKIWQLQILWWVQ